MKGWPFIYTAYHQETEPPYRHARHAYVIRLGRMGFVVGRYTHAWQNEDEAHAAALGARPVPPWWKGEDPDWRYEDEPDDGSFGSMVEA